MSICGWVVLGLGVVSAKDKAYSSSFFLEHADKLSYFFQKVI